MIFGCFSAYSSVFIKVIELPKKLSSTMLRKSSMVMFESEISDQNTKSEYSELNLLSQQTFQLVSIIYPILSASEWVLDYRHLIFIHVLDETITSMITVWPWNWWDQDTRCQNKQLKAQFWIWVRLLNCVFERWASILSYHWIHHVTMKGYVC